MNSVGRLTDASLKFHMSQKSATLTRFSTQFNDVDGLCNIERGDMIKIEHPALPMSRHKS